MTKKWTKIILVVGLLGGLGGCGTEKSQSKKLLVSHGHNTEHPVNKALHFISDKMNQENKTGLKFDIYPNGQLGGERDVIELVKAGVLDMAKVSASALEQFNPSFSIFSLPYVFKSTEHYYDVMENSEVVQEIFKSGEEKGIIAIAWYDSGSRSIYTKKQMEIKNPKDLNGLKIRTQESSTSTKMIRHMGGSPTPMSSGEVYTSLQQGVIDGAENNETVLLDSGHGEVTGAYTYTQHQYSPDIVIISTKTWKNLSEDERKNLLQAANDSTQYHKNLWQELVYRNKEGGEKLGVKFYTIDKKPFIDAVQPLHQEFITKNEMNKYYFEEIQKRAK